MPQVSILIPALIDTDDKADWLIECLDSIKTQTLTDFEAIIVDDASPKSLDDARRHVADDGRFLFVRSPHRSGPALCRNTAAALAKSDALLPLDSDDKLATPEALQAMFAAWDEDRRRVVYGDLQRLVFDGRQWMAGKVIRLGEYSFDNVLDLRGIMPVTSMHSREAWEQGGGWKGRYNAGLEDVEYWIALGELGYCGKKVNALTLQYRKHDTSRTHNVRHVETVDGQPADEVMRRWIIEDHKDTFEGRFPMGCCGSRSGSPSSNGDSGGQMQMMSLSTNMNNNSLALDDTLPNVSGDSKIWVQYVGRRQKHSVKGRNTNLHYNVKGPGHKREVHISDIPQFEGKHEGPRMAFKVGVPAPVDHMPEPVVIEAPRPAERPAPEMAAIERMPDQTGPIPVVKVDNLPPTPTYDYDLGKLKLTERIQARYKPEEVHSMLQSESWSIQALAKASEADLTAYPGIGPAIARTVIQAAKEAL